MVRQLNIPWKEAAPSTKRYYRQKGKEIVEVALYCLTPGQAIELLSELMNYMEKRERRKSADTGVSEISRLIKLYEESVYQKANSVSICKRLH